MTLMYNSPVAGPITFPYGARYKNGTYHKGIDWAVTPRIIRCAANGVVTTAGWSTTGFGWQVRVKLDDGNTIIYGHGMKGTYRVRVGQRVVRNQILMTSDNSGNSTGNHVHMEARKYSFVPLSAWNFTSRLLRYQPA